MSDQLKRQSKTEPRTVLWPWLPSNNREMGLASSGSGEVHKTHTLDQRRRRATVPRTERCSTRCSARTEWQKRAPPVRKVTPQTLRNFASVLRAHWNRGQIEGTDSKGLRAARSEAGRGGGPRDAEGASGLRPAGPHAGPPAGRSSHRKGGGGNPAPLIIPLLPRKARGETRRVCGGGRGAGRRPRRAGRHASTRRLRRAKGAR